MSNIKCINIRYIAKYKINSAYVVTLWLSVLCKITASNKKKVQNGFVNTPEALAYSVML